MAGGGLDTKSKPSASPTLQFWSLCRIEHGRGETGFSSLTVLALLASTKAAKMITAEITACAAVRLIILLYFRGQKKFGDDDAPTPYRVHTLPFGDFHRLCPD
jgi:hypothetical protein